MNVYYVYIPYHYIHNVPILYRVFLHRFDLYHKNYKRGVEFPGEQMSKTYDY